MELNYIEQVELLREKMIKTGMEQGLQNAETLKISRQIDALLNEYAHFEKNEYSSMGAGKNIY